MATATATKGGMTEDEFIEHWTRLPAEWARALGFYVERCYCDGEHPSCSGWVLGYRQRMTLREVDGQDG
jgi:hypothetical protein